MKIINHLLLSAIGLFAVLSAPAQSSVWKVEKNGKTVYLGGTVHLLRPDDYPLPQEFYEAYSQSRALVLETDIEKAQDPSIVQTLMSEIMYTDGTTLSSVLSPEVYKKMEEAATEIGLPMMAINLFKPGMAMLSLSMMKLQSENVSEEGVDMHFLKKAQEDTLKIMFLESAESQIQLIGKMGEGNEDEYVLYALEDLDNLNKEFDSVVEDWKTGNSKTISKVNKQMKKNTPDVYNSMLVNRNNNWMPIIEGYFNTNPVEFVLVGSAHLHGPDGLLTLLKKKGYTITQLKTAK